MGRHPLFWNRTFRLLASGIVVLMLKDQENCVASRGKMKSRRRFLLELGGFTIATSAFAKENPVSGAEKHLSEGIHESAQSLASIKGAPRHQSTFQFLPLGSIQPRGWLRNQLQIQARGLSGHLDETWADVGPNSGWLGGSGESWERGPYFIDGLIPLAWLLDDKGLRAKAEKFIDWTLEHQADSGMLGPKSTDDWWPRIVMLKALTQYQELTQDHRVIPAMDRYLRYQLASLPDRPLRDWGKFRWQDEVISVLWLYDRTGSEYLLELARLLSKQGHDWIAQYANFEYKQKITRDFLKLDQGAGLQDLALSTHGVNNAQAIKAGPVRYLLTGSEADRMATRRMLDELDRYHGLPNGMFSCDEHFAGRDPSQGSELCSVVESMYSLEVALAITGDPVLGDRLEKLAFNSLPGTFTDDMWAHQYNQEPNQIECSVHQKPWTTDGPDSNLFGLEPNFGCCTANFHQGWPKFTNSLFMSSSSGSSATADGLVAVAYAPCEVKTVIRGIGVKITEETGYPFRSTVNFKVDPVRPLRFPLQLRIPAWASGARLEVNGHNQSAPKPGTFARVDRLWNPGDRVQLVFPMVPVVSNWLNRSIAIERGPLVFSLAIEERWHKLRDRGMTADWEVLPSSSWNFALDLDPDHPEHKLTVTESPIGDFVFSRNGAPVRIQATGRKILQWKSEGGVTDPLPNGPISTETPRESIVLLPYAAAKLRITAFPLAAADAQSNRRSFAFDESEP
jgi:uncharacterized protein